MPETSPVEETLAGNRTCPECDAVTVTYQKVNHKNLVCDRFIKFTCQNGHTWESPVVEE